MPNMRCDQIGSEGDIDATSSWLTMSARRHGMHGRSFERKERMKVGTVADAD